MVTGDHRASGGPSPDTQCRGTRRPGRVDLAIEQGLRGLKIHDDLRHPAISDTVGIQIIVGNKKSDNRRDADSMYKLLTRNRPKQEEMKIANREVFLEPLDTSLQGVKLLGIKDLLIDKRIAKFVELRLTNINLPSFRWADRSRKN